VCLTALQAGLDATPVDGTQWRAYYDAYLANGLASGAPFPA
jgi:hypothetical protein